MTAREAKHQYQLTQWAGKIAERSKSGMTIKDWCAANGIKPRVYHYWLRRVREYAAQFLPVPKSPEPSSMPVELPAYNERCVAQGLALARQAAVVPGGWAICEPAPPPAESGQGITIEIGKGRITATADTDADLLTKVCRILVAL